ncbi:MAG: DUF3037 domain-containing protein [Planctomycetota bacterium]
MRPYIACILRFHPFGPDSEFVNVGFLAAMLDGETASKAVATQVPLRVKRVRCLAPHTEANAFKIMLRQASHRIKRAWETQGAAIVTADRFAGVLEEQLGFNDQSSFRWGPLMHGLTSTLTTLTADLRETFLERDSIAAETPQLSRSELRRRAAKVFRRFQVPIEHDVRVATDYYGYTFPFAWQNGQRQLVDVLSFDVKEEETIVKKGLAWRGRLDALSESNEFMFTPIVAPPQPGKLRVAYDEAMHLIASSNRLRTVVREDTLVAFAQEVRSEIASD